MFLLRELLQLLDRRAVLQGSKRNLQKGASLCECRPGGLHWWDDNLYTQQDFNTNGNQKITAFKPGFRMILGNPNANHSMTPGLRYTCLQTVMTRGPEQNAFPAQPCPAGIMTAHHFPACWDGVNLDSPDHQSHMYDTGKGGFAVAGPCPSSHPPTDGSQLLVWSTGDDVGYSTHGDYVFGWKGDALQKAMDSSCMFQACGNGKPLASQSAAELNKCSIKPTVNEETDGCLKALPGHALS